MRAACQCPLPSGSITQLTSLCPSLLQDQRYYPTVDVVIKAKKSKIQRPAKFRASLQPGAVCILLSGKFKGKRVVHLANLPSGLILVSGPFNVNGVPLKRVDPAYVIATSTKVGAAHAILPPTHPRLLDWTCVCVWPCLFRIVRMMT